MTPRALRPQSRAARRRAAPQDATTLEGAGGTIRPTSTPFLRALGWTIATFAWITLVGLLGEIPRALIHSANAGALVALAMQAGVVAGAAVKVRRLVVPNPVWIGLLLLGILNVWSVLVMSSAFHLMFSLLGDYGQELSASVRYPSTPAATLVRASMQGPIFLSAAAAWTLSPGGKVFRSRRSMIAFTVFVCLLAFAMVMGTWYTFAGTYAIASIGGRLERLRPGQSVELVGDLGSVLVPIGWTGELDTPIEQPPKWFMRPPGVDYFDPSPSLLSVTLTPTAASAVPSTTLSDRSVLFVTNDRALWERNLQRARKDRRRYPIPGDVTLPEGNVAFSHTTTTSVASVWRTTITVFVPDTTSPATIALVILHPRSELPSSTVLDRLRPFRLRSPRP